MERTPKNSTPVEPMPRKHFRLARAIRWLLFGACILGLGYLLWEPYRWSGLAVTAVIAVLWVLEIVRGNQSEDYIIENYENPLT